MTRGHGAKPAPESAPPDLAACPGLACPAAVGARGNGGAEPAERRQINSKKIYEGTKAMKTFNTRTWQGPVSETGFPAPLIGPGCFRPRREPTNFVNPAGGECRQGHPGKQNSINNLRPRRKPIAKRPAVEGSDPRKNVKVSIGHLRSGFGRAGVYFYAMGMAQGKANCPDNRPFHEGGGPPALNVGVRPRPRR